MNIPVPLTEIFQRPTIRELAQYAAQTGTQSFQTISAVEKKEYYPLSSAQKRLYFLQSLKPRSTVYNIPTLLPLPDDVEIPRLERAFKQLIKRHESLRTSFHMINDELIQRVHEDVPFQVQTFDGPDAVSPFDLSQAPLLRAGLVTGEEGRRLLLVDMHHIITDGSSQVILTREFLELYAYPEAQLPSLPLQYKDFALW